MLDVTSDDIEAIVRSIFDATFALPVERLDGIDAARGDMTSSVIGISGCWDGAVIVDCTPEVARELATAMFGISDPEIDRSHVEDTLGELANMVGGNLKCMLPPPCSLSLPTIVEGRDYRVGIPGASIERDLHFAVSSGRLRVVVAERGSARMR